MYVCMYVCMYVNCCFSFSIWVTVTVKRDFATSLREMFHKRVSQILLKDSPLLAAQAQPPPNFGTTQIFEAARENLGKAGFKTRFHVFFYQFEELTIFYFNLTLA